MQNCLPMPQMLINCLKMKELGLTVWNHSYLPTLLWNLAWYLEFPLSFPMKNFRTLLYAKPTTSHQVNTANANQRQRHKRVGANDKNKNFTICKRLLPDYKLIMCQRKSRWCSLSWAANITCKYWDNVWSVQNMDTKLSSTRARQLWAQSQKIWMPFTTKNWPISETDINKENTSRKNLRNCW